MHFVAVVYNMYDTTRTWQGTKEGGGVIQGIHTKMKATKLIREHKV